MQCICDQQPPEIPGAACHCSTTDMREARETNITLHGVDGLVLAAFIRFLYTCHCSIVTEKLVGLCAMADQYDVTLLQQLCMDAIRMHVSNHRSASQHIPSGADSVALLFVVQCNMPTEMCVDLHCPHVVCGAAGAAVCSTRLQRRRSSNPYRSWHGSKCPATCSAWHSGMTCLCNWSLMRCSGCTTHQMYHMQPALRRMKYSYQGTEGIGSQFGRA